MAIRVYYVLAIVGSFLVSYCSTYPDGAPGAVCYNFLPGHEDAEDFSAQVDYKEYFQVDTEKSGESVIVTLRAVDPSRLFKGFVLRAVPGTYDPENWDDQPEPVGTWEDHPDANLISCDDGDDNAISHIDNDFKVEATFTWTPPKYDEDSDRTVTFVATVVETVTRFFSGIASDVVDLS